MRDRDQLGQEIIAKLPESVQILLATRARQPTLQGGCVSEEWLDPVTPWTMAEFQEEIKLNEETVTLLTTRVVKLEKYKHLVIKGGSVAARYMQANVTLMGIVSSTAYGLDGRHGSFIRVKGTDKYIGFVGYIESTEDPALVEDVILFNFDDKVDLPALDATNFIRELAKTHREVWWAASKKHPDLIRVYKTAIDRFRKEGFDAKSNVARDMKHRSTLSAHGLVGFCVRRRLEK